jgi:mono/diheme cytochrome c family protein
MNRSSLISLVLVGLAVVLLALSFVPWDRMAADPISSTTASLSPEPSTRTLVETGRTLFAIKGCATCHRHDGLGIDRLSQGGERIPISESFLVGGGAPDLTHYQPAPDFVRQWLADPKAVRSNTRMPDLNLSEDEIEALLAFLRTNAPE